ncbi:MAG: ATP synthase F1 subunit epsilon [Myxococcota bacterium]
MPPQLELRVVTPEGQAFRGPAESVVLPGAEGDFGVLPGHEVFLSALRIGPMTIQPPSGDALHAVVSGGFAEVHDDQVSVMVGSCEFAHEIDRSRAEIARDRALKQLEEMRATAEGEAAYQKYQDAYSRAITRIAVSDRFKT